MISVTDTTSAAIMDFKVALAGIIFVGSTGMASATFCYFVKLANMTNPLCPWHGIMWNLESNAKSQNVIDPEENKYWNKIIVSSFASLIYESPRLVKITRDVRSLENLTLEFDTLVAILNRWEISDFRNPIWRQMRLKVPNLSLVTHKKLLSDDIKVKFNDNVPKITSGSGNLDWQICRAGWQICSWSSKC